MRNWFEGKRGRRMLSLALSMAMVLSLAPMPSFAAESDGLCEHHPEHTPDCGYVAAVEGQECSHVCGEECYTVATDCKHIHNADCYSDGELPAETPKEADACTHACTEESGCLTKAHTCVHTAHDDSCGYAPAVAGQPCGFDCQECAGKKSNPTEPSSEPTTEPAGDTVITGWEWVDDYELIDPETGLAHLPFASAEKIAYFDSVRELLPTAITVDGGELSLGEWLCEDYPVETGAYEGEYVFETTLPEGYTLPDGTNVLRLTVVLGDPEGHDAAFYSDAPNTGTYTIDGITCEAYELRTADDLFWLAEQVNTGETEKENYNAVLMNDIVIPEDRAWTPIGGILTSNLHNDSFLSSFTGNFDGRGHVISGLQCTSTSGHSYVGLFGMVASPVIVNVGIEDSTFTAGDDGHCGSLIGYAAGTANGSAIVKNCYSTATVVSQTYGIMVGGLVGRAARLSIQNCYFAGTVSATGDNTGSMIGFGNNPYVRNCYYDTDKCNLSGCGGGGYEKNIVGRTTAQFQSGEVAYALCSGDTIWGQRIPENGEEPDPYPGFNDYIVYCAANYENYHNHKGHENVRTPYCLLCGNMYGSQLGDVYQITTKDQLYWFAAKVNGTSDAQQDASIKGRLGRDITLVDGWKPIGNQKVFTGSFDGNGFTITCPLGTPMLFQTVGSDATIDHLRIGNGSLSETNNGTITRCVVLDSSSKLCATNSGTIINSYASGSGAMKLCDTNTGTIANCYAAGGSGTAIGSGGTISNCYTLAGDTAYGTNFITSSPFSSGEVAYLLNRGTVTYPGGIWGQTIGTNSLPIHYGKSIYYNDTAKYHNHDGYCSTCNPKEPAYDETNKVWQISNADDLNWFAAFVNGVYTGYSDRSQNAVLTADIRVNTGVLNPDGTLSANADAFEIWTPIGSLKNYTGTFDGQNHTISGLYCPEADYAGLFGIIFKNASVQNVHISDSYFAGTKDAGGVCGSSSNGCTIQNCSNAGTISGRKNAGGICGENTSGGGKSSTIQSCYSTGMVSGSGKVGGVCGNNYNSTIQDCYFNSDVFTGAAIGSGDGTNVAGKTTKEFASGEVAYLLNGSKDNGTWKQTIEGAAPDATPQLTGKAVYKTIESSPCPGYTNNSTGTRLHYYENHVCIYCDHRDTSPVTVNGIKARDKEYDGSKTATLDYSGVTLSGVNAGDDVSVTATGTFDNANVGTGKTVSISNLKLTGTNAEKYYLAESGQQAKATASIKARDITVTITPGGGTYGNVTPATAKLNNVVSGETVPVTLTYTGTANDGTEYNSTTAPSKAGSYTVTASISNSNYSLTGTIKADFKIEKATVITPTLNSKAYTGSNLTANISDTERYTVSQNNGGTNVGSYDVVLTLKDSANYQWDEKGGKPTFQITKAANQWTTSPAITGWTYGGTPSTPTGAAKFGTMKVEYTSDGTTYGETVPTNAGTYIARFTVEATDNYAGLSVEKDFTISPKSVTVSGITAGNKTYDGNTDAELVCTNADFDGKLAGDTLAVTATGAFEDENAGENKTVAITGLTLGGASKDNYTLAAEGQQKTTTASILVRSIDKPQENTTAFTYTGSQQTYTLTESEWYTITGNTRTDAGSQTVTVTLKDTRNTRWADGTTDNVTFSFVIGKAASSVTAAPADARSLYTGGNVPLIKAGTAQGGTMHYSLDGETWSADIPTATDWKTYTVYYKVAGDNNHTDTVAQTLTAEIVPFRIPSQPLPQDINYGMDAMLSVDLQTSVTEGISYQWCLVTVEDGKEIYTPLEGETSKELALTKPNAGTYVYACIITCGDYSETSGTATVTVHPGEIPVGPDTDIDLSGFWLEGGEAPASENQTSIPEKSPSSRLLTKYTTATNTQGDAYPSGMQVYKLDENNKPVEIADLGNLLRYSGCSIRITGKPGIRMITSLTKEAKEALKKGELAGYTLEEYGTVVAWKNTLGDQPLTLSTGKSNYAYRQGVSDPVFANVGELTQYTNVLVWNELDDGKYIEDIVMRPYIKLSKDGETVTLYGGTVSRSIGYVAQQNANTFPEGSAGYKYVHEIIDKVNALKAPADTTTGGNAE